ncbi:MAG: hypothetical protein ACI4RL_05695 [Ruminococcus sp.]
MKKLLSLTLAVVIALSILIVPMGTGATTNSKKTVKTYIATGVEYITSKGKAYSQGRKLYFTHNNGETYNLTNHWGNAVRSFYVRGDTVYYCKLGNVFSVDTKGENRKKLYGKEDADKILGGYGSAVIIFISDTNNQSFKKIKDGKITTLFERSIPDNDERFYEYYNALDVTLFNGRIYFNNNNKVYDLATNETKSFKASQIVGTENYLYYVNKVNNLRRIDKKGNNKLVAKNVTKLYASNDGATVVYGKKDTTTGKEYLYRRTGIKDQTYRLCSVEDLGATLGVEESKTNINCAYIVPGKVYLLINKKIVLSVGSKGGTPNVLCKSEGEYERCTLGYSHSEVYYYNEEYDADTLFDD